MNGSELNCGQRRCQQTDNDWTASAVNRAPACHKGLQCMQLSMINSLRHTPCQTFGSQPANQAQPPRQKSAFHIPVSRHFTRSKRSPAETADPGLQLRCRYLEPPMGGQGRLFCSVDESSSNRPAIDPIRSGKIRGNRQEAEEDHAVYQSRFTPHCCASSKVRHQMQAARAVPNR